MKDNSLYQEGCKPDTCQPRVNAVSSGIKKRKYKLNRKNMKRSITLIIITVLCAVSLFAQTPPHALDGDQRGKHSNEKDFHGA